MFKRTFKFVLLNSALEKEQHIKSEMKKNCHKAPIRTVADDRLYFFFSKKISLDISCESSAKQMIHMKCHDLLSLIFFLKNENVVCYKFCSALKGLKLNNVH